MNNLMLESIISHALKLIKEGNIKDAEELLQQANKDINKSHLKMFRGNSPQRIHDDD